MKLANNPRWITILAAAILVVGGLAIILSSNQNLSKGPLFSPIPSPGYERTLSYTEVGYLGTLMLAIGVMLGIASIGIRKWPRYQPRTEYIEGLKAVGISIATTNYEKDRSILHEVMRSTELTVNTKNEFTISEPEYKMGWCFFVLHVTPNLMDKIIGHIDTGHTMPNVKYEDRFIRRLSEKLEEKRCRVYLYLESRKGSSKYGLF